MVESVPIADCPPPPVMTQFGEAGVDGTEACSLGLRPLGKDVNRRTARGQPGMSLKLDHQ